MLRILYGACATALETFRAADNLLDEQLVADLEKMVERTELEIERIAALSVSNVHHSHRDLLRRRS